MRGGPALRDRARQLRSNMTDAELLLWRELRRGAFGWRFRRQFPIPPYIADFACVEARLIIELDGGQHAAAGGDMPRDGVLRRRGWRVVRFWNKRFSRTGPACCMQLPMCSDLAVRIPPPRPSPA